MYKVYKHRGQFAVWEQDDETGEFVGIEPVFICGDRAEARAKAAELNAPAPVEETAQIEAQPVKAVKRSKKKPTRKAD